MGGAGKCLLREIPTVRGPREEGRIAREKYLLSSRERPPLFPGVILDTYQAYGLMLDRHGST